MSKYGAIEEGPNMNQENERLIKAKKEMEQHVINDILNLISDRLEEVIYTYSRDFDISEEVWDYINEELDKKEDTLEGSDILYLIFDPIVEKIGTQLKKALE